MIEFLQQNKSTSIFCILIIVAGLCYFWNLGVIYCKFNRRWKKKKDFDKNMTNIDKDKYLGSIFEEYYSVVIFPNENLELKTDIRANDFFNVSSVLRSLKINHRAMSSASSILVGLGLLGTFLGLTLGVYQFDSSSTESIQNSISTLLGGMGTAFLTSLFGMGFSTVYIVFEKAILNKLSRRIDKICTYLDKKYFISQPEKYVLLYQRKDQQFASLFTIKDENGNIITPANLLRDIYEENRKQTKALAGFTEELFFEVANNAMNDSLKPLVAEVKNVTDTLSVKLEEFAETVKSPGENLADSIVKELKESITTLLTELKQSVSNIAGDKIDELNSEMQSATIALASFPEKMESMMSSLSDHFSNINHLVDKLVKDSSSINEGNVTQMQDQIESVSKMMTSTTSQIERLISDMSAKSYDTNTSIVQQMQEQVNYSTTNMNNLTNTIEEVMTKLSRQTEESSSNIVKGQEQVQERSNKVLEEFTNSLASVMMDAVSKFNKQAEDANSSMLENHELVQEQSSEANKALLQQVQDQVNHNSTNMTNLVSLVQETVTKLNKQSEDIGFNMMVSQEQNQNLSDKTISSFNATISGLEELMSNIRNTINQFTNLQNETNQTASHLNELSRNTLSTTVTLRDAQSEFISEVKDNSIKSLESIQGLETALSKAKDLPQEYVDKFGTIRESLTVIFEGINGGLNQYSTTVKNSTQEFLDIYSKSLTDSVTALSAAIEEFSGIVEDLQETNNSNRK